MHIKKVAAATGSVTALSLVLTAGLGLSGPVSSADTRAAPSHVAVTSHGDAAREGVASAHERARGRIARGAETTASARGFVASPAGGDVVIPHDAGGRVVVERGGAPVEIDLPGGGYAKGAAALGGVVFDRAVTDTTVVVKATDEGGAQVLAVLGSHAPRTLAFPVTAAPGSALERNPDGSVTLLERIALGDGKTVDSIRGEFSAPWAVDANGAAVQTTYAVRGMKLVQRIHPTAATAFPVTADPSFHVGWTGLFVHWTRSEVRWLNGLGMTALATAVGTLCAGPHAALCAAAVISIYYVVHGMTNRAVDVLYNRGYRVTTRLTPFTRTYVERR